VTSTEAGVLQASTSANKKDKMKFDSVEEPATRSATPINAKVTADATAAAVRKSKIGHLEMTFNTIKNTARDHDEILQRCTKLMTVNCGESNHPGSEPLADRWCILLGQLVEAVKLARTIEREPGSDDAFEGWKMERLLEVTKSLREGREDLFGAMLDFARAQRDSKGKNAKLPKLADLTKEQQIELESLVSVISQPMARALPLLVQNGWNLNSAIEAYYQQNQDESINSDEEEDIANAIRQSQNELPQDEYFSTAPSGPGAYTSKPSRSKWLPNPTRAGSSGVKKLPKLTEEQEAADLETARSRFTQLLRQNDEEDELENQAENNEGNGARQDEDNGDKSFGATKDDIERQKLTDPELRAITARIVEMNRRQQEAEERKQTLSPQLAELLKQGMEGGSFLPAVSNLACSVDGTIYKSIEKNNEMATKCPSFKTTLDGINERKRTSPGDHHLGSPTKKQRENSDYIAENYVNLDNVHMPPADHPSDDNTMENLTEEPLDMDTKLAMLISMDLASQELCEKQLEQNKGDLEHTILELQAMATLRTLDERDVNTTTAKPSQNDNQPSSQSQPLSFLELTERVKILMKMDLGLRLDGRCIEALQETRGDIPRTVKILRNEAAAAARGGPLPSPLPVSEESLAALRFMGFPDDEKNREMLEVCNDNLEMVIEELLKPGSEATSPGNSEEEKKTTTAPALKQMANDVLVKLTRKKETGIKLGDHANKMGESERTNCFPAMQDTSIEPELKYKGKGKAKVPDLTTSAAPQLPLLKLGGIKSLLNDPIEDKPELPPITGSTQFLIDKLAPSLQQRRLAGLRKREKDGLLSAEMRAELTYFEQRQDNASASGSNTPIGQTAAEDEKDPVEGIFVDDDLARFQNEWLADLRAWRGKEGKDDGRDSKMAAERRQNTWVEQREGVETMEDGSDIDAEGEDDGDDMEMKGKEGIASDIDAEGQDDNEAKMDVIE
jgi:hypothetical protein